MTPLRVVVAGGGVAAAEAVLALRDLAGDRVALELVAPEKEFELKALRTAEPFAAGRVARRPMRELADRAGATLHADAVAAVQPERHAVRLASGAALEYDHLVLAVGARPRTAFHRAITFGDVPRSGALNGLLADLDEGWTRSVAFVVPPGRTWPLPLYEIALQTAVQAHGMGARDVAFSLVTPEPAPLAVFGPAGSDAVARLLDDAGIAFRGDASAVADEHGRLRVGGAPLEAERVVTIPVLEGPSIVGVPSDADGFLPVDGHGRVLGADGVLAAGDGTDFPVKQGGIAGQQADAVARWIAAQAGADVEPRPFAPVLRGQVLAGPAAAHLQHTLGDDAGGADPAPDVRLWAPERKVDAHYLVAWLGADEPAAAAGETVAVEVELPTPWERYG